MKGKKKRCAVEWSKNVIIFLLILSAFYLIGRSHLCGDFEQVLKGSGLLSGYKTKSDEQNTETARFGAVQLTRLAIQNELGRYGVQYDSDTLETLFETKLGNLLGEALYSAGDCCLVSENQWRTVLTSQTPVVYYEFLGKFSLSELSARLGEENVQLQGETNQLFLTKEGSKGNLYYYNQCDGQYYVCQTQGNIGYRLDNIVSGYRPNGAVFAFEHMNYSSLAPYTMILPEPPNVPTYTASNPTARLSDEDRATLLRSLSFNPQSAAVYPSVDGLVVREGTDTLRILNTGMLTFHGMKKLPSRYPQTQMKPNDLVMTASNILELVITDWCGEARIYCLGVEKFEKGKMAVSFGYALNGARVLIHDQECVARFIFENGCVESFSIQLRWYQKMETKSVVLPELQASALLKTVKLTGNRLFLCYRDDGEEQISAGWMTQG